MHSVFHVCFDFFHHVLLISSGDSVFIVSCKLEISVTDYDDFKKFIAGEFDGLKLSGKSTGLGLL